MVNVDKNNIINLICLKSGVKEKELEALKSRLEKMNESQLQAELTEMISGSNEITNSGLVVEHHTPQTNYKINIEKNKLTEDQAKEEIINTIMNDVNDAYALLKGQDNGIITSGYDKLKNYFDSDLSSSNVKEALELQATGANNLIKARDGELTKKEYFLQNREHLKNMLTRRLYDKDEKTGLDFLDKNKGNMSKEKFAKSLDKYINESINKIQDLDSLKSAQHNLATSTLKQTEQNLNKLLNNAKNQKPELVNGIEQNTTDIKFSRIPAEFDSQEPIKFEEVFKYERGKDYSRENVENYLQAKNKLNFAAGAFNKFQEYKTSIDEYMDNNRDDKADTGATERKEQALKLFESFYAASPNADATKNYVKSLVEKSKLPVDMIEKEDGSYDLDMSAYQSDAQKNKALNFLVRLSLQDKKQDLNNLLGGNYEDKLSSYSKEIENTYSSAYGTDRSKELVQAMENDNKSAIQKYTGNASMAGIGLTVVGGMLCFTPIAPVGAGMITAGNTLAVSGMISESALGYTEALSRENVDKEELKDLTKNMLMNSGGFIVGFQAGKLGMKSFNKLIDQKLTETFAKEITNGNRMQALKEVFANPSNFANFSKAAGAKISTDFLISYMGDLAMTGALGTNDNWESLLQANLTGVLVGMSSDVKDVANVGKRPQIATKTQLKLDNNIFSPKDVQDLKTEGQEIKNPTSNETQGEDGVRNLFERFKRTASKESLAILNEIKNTPVAEENKVFAETSTKGYKDLTDAEFNAMKSQVKAKINDNAILKEELGSTKLTKENIQVARYIIDNSKLLNNRNFVDNIGVIVFGSISKENTQAKIDVLEAINANPKLLNSKSFADNVGNIVHRSISKESAQAKIDIMEYIKNDPNLSNNKSFTNEIGSIIYSSKDKESAQARIDVMEHVKNNPELLNNKSFANNVGNIVLWSGSKESAQARIDIMEHVKNNPKLLNNPSLAKNFGNLIIDTNNLESTRVTKHIIKNPVFLEKDNFLGKIRNILTESNDAEKAQARIDIMEAINANPKLLDNEDFSNIVGDIILNANSKELANIKISVIEAINANPKLSDNKSFAKVTGDIILNTNTDEIANAKINLIETIKANPKILDNKNFANEVGNIIYHSNSLDGAKVKSDVMNNFCKNEELFSNPEFNIGEFMVKTSSGNGILAAQLVSTKGLDIGTYNKILDSIVINNHIFFNGNIDVKKAKTYTNLLQNPNISDFVIKLLNSGMDMNTVGFLAKTKKKLNAQKAETETSTPKPNNNINENLQAVYEIFSARGLNDKESKAVVNAITTDNIVDSRLQAQALKLIEQGVPTNKIGEVIKNAQISGEYNQKIVDNFISLQELNVNPLLEKNLAVLNNISNKDTVHNFNSKVRKQILGMIQSLSPEIKTALANKDINLEQISKNLNMEIVQTTDKTPQKVKVISGLRSKQSIKGFERVIIDKYNPDQKVWQNKTSTRQWAEEKYSTIMNGNYKSINYPKANEARETGLSEWAEFMNSELEFKDNPFAKIVIANFITKDLAPENANIPPQLDKKLAKEILTSAINSENVNFSKLYADKIREKAMKGSMSKQVEVDGIKGTWYTVAQTDKSNPNYQTNVDKVKAFSDGTNWCIRTISAKTHVEQGAMHFFVDENGLTQICIRETAPGSVYEIQKRRQNATVPIAYINVINSYMKANGLKAQETCKSRINKAKSLKPKFDKLRNKFYNLVQKKDYKSILEEIGVKVQVNADGTFTLSHYNPEFKDFTLSDLGIKENELLNNVKSINGDATFTNSNASTLPMLEKVAGTFTFEDCNLSYLPKLKYINGYEVKWNN